MSRLMNVKRAFAEDYRDCAGNHAAEWEEERPIDVLVTVDGNEYPLCRGHAHQLREMLDELLAEMATPEERDG